MTANVKKASVTVVGSIDPGKEHQQNSYMYKLNGASFQ